MYKIGICGSEGMVGGALKRYFENKKNYKLKCYDKKGVGKIEDMDSCDFIYIAVPTPAGSDNSCDTSIVEEVVSSIKGEKVIIIKSTVPPGTTDRLQKEYPQHKFLFNPEFLTELTADNDMSFPDRQILGYTKKSYTVAKEVIQQLPLAPFEKMVTAKEAEMCKYFNNTWFSTKVIFANQIYDLCKKMGIDYEIVASCAAADKRVGRTHLKVYHKGYRGYGGKCLPKDTKALVALGDKVGSEMKLLKTVELINKELCQNV